MSKLGDQIRKASRLESAPLGFGMGAPRKAVPSLLCLVRLSSGEAGKAQEAASKGAHAVIIEGAEPNRVQELTRRLGSGESEKAPPVAVGVRLVKAERPAVAAQREAGADFVVLDELASAEALLEEGIGVVLALGRDTSDTALRLMADLPLDALLVQPPEGPLGLGRFLELRRLSVFSRTPLLMEVAPGASPSYLQALREAGVAGVIIDSRALDRLPALRQTVEGLPTRGRRRAERPEALLPAAAPAGDAEEEEEFS